MDEMNLLAAMRSEVPLAPPSANAERLFRVGLAEDAHTERVPPTRPRLRFLPGLVDAHGQVRWWRIAVPGALAAGLAAALVVSLLPQDGGPPADAGQATVDPTNGTTMSAQLLADIAGKSVLAQKAVKPEQWVYQKIENYSANPPGAPSYAKSPGNPVSIQTQWTMADGGETVWGPPVNGQYSGGLVLDGPNKKVDEQDKKILASAAAAYSKLSSLPKNPAALEAYFAHQDEKISNPAPALLALNAYSRIQDLLSSGILPPSVTAELYHAMADVPGVVAKKNVQLVTGQSGVGFVLPQSTFSINQETILSPTTYQYLGRASWSNPPYVWKKSGNGWSGPNPFNETVLLAEAPVSAPGKLP